MLDAYEIADSIKEQIVKMKATYESEQKAILNLNDPIDEECKQRYNVLTHKVITLEHVLYTIDKTVDNFRRID